MASNIENETVEETGVSIHAKRNKCKKDLAKQRETETKTKGAMEDKLLDKLSTVNLVEARQQTTYQPTPRTSRFLRVC